MTVLLWPKKMEGENQSGAVSAVNRCVGRTFKRVTVAVAGCSLLGRLLEVTHAANFMFDLDGRLMGCRRTGATAMSPQGE